MKALVLLMVLLTSACGSEMPAMELPQPKSEATEVIVDEKAPLTKFENGITKTVDFAFEGMDPLIELIPEENKIIVSFPNETKELIDSSEVLAEMIEENAKVLYKALGQMYSFDGTLTVDKLTISE